MEVLQFLKGTRAAFNKLLEENKLKEMSFYVVDESQDDDTQIKKEEE